MMKRSLIVPLLVAVAVGALSYALTRRAICAGNRHSIGRFENVSFLSRELGLTEAQAREIRELQASLSVELNDCRERHCAARVRLGKALAGETNGPARARAMIAEMCRAYEAGELATLEHIQSVRDLLDPEQKRRFDALVGECICKSCAACGVCVEADRKAPSAGNRRNFYE